MLSLLLATTLSLAQATEPTEAQSIEQHWRSLTHLEVHPALYRRVEEPITIRDGSSAIRLTDGYLFPIFSGRFAGEWERNKGKALRELRDENSEIDLPTAEERGTKGFVGFVWTKGTGYLSVKLEDRADSMVFANHMVSKMGYAKEDFTKVAHGDKPFVTPISEGLILSIDPEIQAAYLGP
ncbi:MAG: hypothetical protein HN348_05110, partial [Proteobacteria bacterium]|nr:hypothetical protein [Pseudomonadota bacterium]